jgi:hypothetical protein
MDYKIKDKTQIHFPSIFQNGILIPKIKKNKFYFGSISRENPFSGVIKTPYLVEFNYIEKNGIKQVLVLTREVSKFNFSLEDFSLEFRQKYVNWYLNQAGIKKISPVSKQKKSYESESFFNFLINLNQNDPIGLYNDSSSSFYLGDLKNPKKDIKKNHSMQLTMKNVLEVRLKPSENRSVVEWNGYQFKDNGITYQVFNYLPIRWDKNIMAFGNLEELYKFMKKKSKKYNLENLLNFCLPKDINKN